MDNEVVDSIAVASSADAASFLAYLPRSRSFRSVYTRRYFEWKIETNPFGFSRSYLRFRVGRAAAHCSITAKPMNGAQLRGVRLAELGDTHTHPDFQRQGHFGAIGLHTIETFLSAEDGEALVYGLPNDNALPGWQSRCGCEVWPEMNIRALTLAMSARPKYWRRSLFFGDGLQLRPLNNFGAERVIDEFWNRMADPAHLISKTGSWWRWRYAEATEPYTTYVATRGDIIVGWCVLKRVELLPLVGRTTVCDIVTANSETQAEILGVLLKRIVRPLDAVSIWVQSGTALDGVARELGFEEVRQVPIVFYDNYTYQRFRAGRVPLLSAGDTDNV
jgi:hypothetical protein